VQWGKDYRDSPFLTTLSQNAGNVSTGNVYLWKLNEPHNLNVPVCVLSGHDRDPCTSFQWVVLDDPSAGTVTNNAVDFISAYSDFVVSQALLQQLLCC